MITCESCGKRYDYLKSEACPNCGAFNYIKGAHQHICGAEDVERIIEMKSAEHDDSQEVVRPDTSIDQGLQQKYARARQKLDRLETTEDVFKSAFGGDFGAKKFSRKAKKMCIRDSLFYHLFRDQDRDIRNLILDLVDGLLLFADDVRFSLFTQKDVYKRQPMGIIESIALIPVCTG